MLLSNRAGKLNWDVIKKNSQVNKLHFNFFFKPKKNLEVQLGKTGGTVG